VFSARFKCKFYTKLILGSLQYTIIAAATDTESGIVMKLGKMSQKKCPLVRNDTAEISSWVENYL
jgi:hypothetical protein